LNTNTYVCCFGSTAALTFFAAGATFTALFFGGLFFVFSVLIMLHISCIVTVAKDVSTVTTELFSFCFFCDAA
jgi:hypothetical protein